jgi:hypothetical protein
MYCVHNGKACVQVWHKRRETWVYIPLKKWYFMSDRERNKYDDWT